MKKVRCVEEEEEERAEEEKCNEEEQEEEGYEGRKRKLKYCLGKGGRGPSDPRN